jgi:hypothetical protein
VRTKLTVEIERCNKHLVDVPKNHCPNHTVLGKLLKTPAKQVSEHSCCERKCQPSPLHKYQDNGPVQL